MCMQIKIIIFANAGFFGADLAFGQSLLILFLPHEGTDLFLNLGVEVLQDFTHEVTAVRRRGR